MNVKINNQIVKITTAQYNALVRIGIKQDFNDISDAYNYVTRMV